MMSTIKFKMMKSFVKWMSGTIAVILMLTLPVAKTQAQYNDDYVSYQTFYDDLSPYGQWVYDPQYGNVWVPDAGNDFRPYYTNGYWAMTEFGNTWVSNYPWGWAPFHYGRWTYNPFYGWVWIPGNVWGPAWVSWRWGGGNCGWAPMGPGVSISVSVGNYSCPNDWWVFVGPRYLYQRNFHNYWRGPRYNTTFINQTTIINNTYNNTYVYGPRPRQIEDVTHQRVNVHRIANGGRGRTEVRNNTVNIYRPQVRNEGGRPNEVVRAPRSIGEPQGGVRNGRPEFKSMVSRGEVRPMENNNPRGGGREQRFDDRSRTDTRQLQRQDRPQIQGQERPQMNRPQQERFERPQQMDRPQRNDRPQQMERAPQRVERPQMSRPQQERFERPQQMDRPQRNDRPQQMERAPQRVERPQQMDRPRPQRMERPQQMDRPQPQRMERPQQMDRPQPQRMERPQQPQRMERPQPQRIERPQQAPRPQPQMQRSNPGGGGQPQGRPGGGDRRSGRGR